MRRRNVTTSQETSQEPATDPSPDVTLTADPSTARESIDAQFTRLTDLVSQSMQTITAKLQDVAQTAELAKLASEEAGAKATDTQQQVSQMQFHANATTTTATDFSTPRVEGAIAGYKRKRRKEDDTLISLFKRRGVGEREVGVNARRVYAR